MRSSLAPSFLVSMPQLVDPNFKRTVVLLCKHSDAIAGGRIADDLYLSTSPDLLRRLLESSPPPTARLMVGYSGWGPGQLEAELETSSWLICEIDRELIFDTPPEQMWEAAIRRLGADPASLTMSRGVH